MGYLGLGQTLSWSEAKKVSQKVRHSGISQLISNWRRKEHLCRNSFVWGDELECTLVKFDHEARKVYLISKGEAYTNELNSGERLPDGYDEKPWKPEYASYMLESIPIFPYKDCLDSLLTIEQNMKERRAKVQRVLQSDEAVLTLTGFPRLGCENYLYKSGAPNLIDGASLSLFIPDDSINPHIRFSTLTRCIRERRGRKVFSNIPIYRDVNTPNPFIEKIPPSLISKVREIHGGKNVENIIDIEPGAIPDCIYIDAMCFGMGCSSLQVTFQACGMRQCRVLYDQLTPLAPLMLSMAASNPIVRGYLANKDSRWDIISSLVDDRTEAEMEPQVCEDGTIQKTKSRFSCVSYYISSGGRPAEACLKKINETGMRQNGGRVFACDFFKDEYNDVNYPTDAKIKERLISEGFDKYIANHYAHLFTRDPLVVFSNLLDVETPEGSADFENIQSTNWQTLRFKPPPVQQDSQTSIGWRVEFRSMEIQLTDRENAFFSIYVNLIARCLLFFNLNFLIPISMVEKNMERCQNIDAVKNEKFLFRKSINYPPLNTEESVFREIFPDSDLTPNPDQVPDLKDEFVELSMDEIVNGIKNDKSFPGLNFIIKHYIDIQLKEGILKEETHSYLLKVLDFFSKKASGKYMTTAQWIRKFVRSHPEYKNDSIVTHEIAYDLLMKVNELGGNFSEDLSRLES